MHKPTWFSEDKVLISFAPTCGIYKNGEERFKIDPKTGKRTAEIDDLLRADVLAVSKGELSETVRWIEHKKLNANTPKVPAYFDDRATNAFVHELQTAWPTYSAASLGELIEDQQIIVRPGHGSPSADVRTGTIPYIKVSDIRAGQININPTNRVGEVIAKQFWGGTTSTLKAFDLITPNRASKNIGEFAILMPGQEQIVLTKEVFVLRPGPKAPFDSFYLLWALSLRVVREQWRRIVFMQTNREDVGSRYREITIPLAPTSEEYARVSMPFRDYYEGTANLRVAFLKYLQADNHHHVFMSSTVEGEDLDANDDLANKAATLNE